ncbi:MAG: alpha/beta hydrolase [Chloroflexi bacterium]|nr:alpha/beta hydrolase [Chloroflexota bacterium]
MPTAAGLYYFAHEAEVTARPPVILIHGAGGTHLNWPPQIRRLDGQPILAVDLPGHGKSDGVSRQVISEYAADILTFMDMLKMRTAILVGHSMGSAIALSIAIQSPKRVLGLGLLGSGARLSVSPSLLQSAADPATFLSAVQRVTEYSYSQQADPRLKELGEKRMAETRPPVLYGDFLACDGFDASADLPHIHAPTLLLVGEQDRMTPPRLSRALNEQIPRSRLVTLPDTGHMLMLEQPDLVAAHLAEFFHSIPYQIGQ